ncbi:hypothetical protein DICPUDRAFT_95240 [Dictyostelium purpureum]|uniref:RSE1/DDB1/CPSF1 first beta-propeller domain-containing protein n=1 Tax=Dictyostelium purpureum TaxID=5786 RepID=F0ZTX2_DICPU|nr:uncharacterized protein DICPUDRAFT_95240 [Dictyostelium purpureum]EGC32608.1 hypothetical protein DICPUDRAFT_95240 [Dictyostelium purpureum]|eukprot:XP_003290860.1 hypothetical protein DICPUDRAFT_95240 [Dictyostelium purpureum]
MTSIIIDEDENIFSSIVSNINIGESNNNVDDSFYYSKTLLNPSVITHTVKGNFRNKYNYNKENKIQELIFIKENCIELVQYFEESQLLESINSQPSFSIIKDVKVLTLPTFITNNNNNNNNNNYNNNNDILTLKNNELNDNIDQNCKEKDFLVITSDSGYLSILTWSNIKKQFIFVQHLRISPPGYSFKYLGDKIQISQCNRIIGVSALKNKLSLFLINNNNNNKDSVLIISKKIDIKDLDGDIYSFNFSYEKDDPYFLTYNHCFINILTTKDKNQIISKFQFNFQTNTVKEIKKNNNLIQSQQQSSQLINYQFINIPKINFISSFNFNYYFLLLLNNKIIFTNSNFEKLKEITIKEDCDDEEFRTIIDDEEYEEYYYKKQNKLITCYNWHQIESTLYLLIGNEMGNLYGIEFTFDSNNFKSSATNFNSFKKFKFKFNPIQNLINLNNGYFGIIGDLSDGGIYNIDFNKYEINECERIENHSGIIDFEIQKQKFTTKIYTCCGGSNSFGSVKVIENSIPTHILHHEKKRIGAIYVWSFSPYIVIGYPSSTVVEKVSVAEEEEDDMFSLDNIYFIENQATIYCYRTSDGTFVQVTPKTIVLYNNKYSKRKESYRWDVGENSIITNACSRDGLLLVAISKPNSIQSFNIVQDDSNDHGLSLKLLNSIPLEFEVSCISLPKFNENEILDKENQIFNTCIVGTYLMNIFILNFKFNKILYSFNETEENQVINAIPNSILLSILNQLNQNQQKSNHLNQQPEKKNRDEINFKLICGLRDGLLLKFDILYNLHSNCFKVSKNIYSKSISSSPVTVLSVLNQGAMVLTDQPYYITSIKNHISLCKISFKNDKMISYCSLYYSENSRQNFLFVNPELGLYLANIDFSKKMSVKTLLSNNQNQQYQNQNQQFQNPNRILLIEKYSILIILNDFNISVLVLSDHLTNYNSNSHILSQSSSSSQLEIFNNNELYYKKIFQTKDSLNFKSNHSIKYWEQKNLIIVYGNNKNNGTIYFYSIQFNHKSNCGSEEISLTLEKKRTFDKPISSVLPFVDGKYLVFTTKGNLMIDYNSGVQSNSEDLNIQITTPFPVTISKFRASDNKLLLGTETNGLDVYRYNQEDKSFTHCSNEKSKFISDAIFLSTDDQIATIDKYGNFKNLNLNQINQMNQELNQPINQEPQQQHNNNQEQQQIQQLQQQLHSIPIILDPINQFSLKESCLKLLQLNNSKIITCSLLGSVILFGKLSRVEYKVLLTIQNSLKNDKSSKPITNNDHNLYRSEISNCKNVLDGDLLYQFLFLEEIDQINLISKLFKLNDINNTKVYLILTKILNLFENFKIL